MVPHRPSQVTDNELILYAYEKWGEHCVERLIGDWAFAIWDSRRQKLFLARDHHGNTGIYYYSNRWLFAFASSLKAILALDVPRRPNPLRIAQVLVPWPAHGSATCYEGILCLPPAHTMTITTDKTEVRRYWFLENTPKLTLRSDADYVDAFLDIYAEAVRCRLGRCRQVGTTLSGGLDSGSVSALAARELTASGNRLQAFSSVPLYNVDRLASPNSFVDERPFIEATRAFTGNIDVHYIRAQSVSPLAGIQRALDIHDQPVHAAANQYWIVALLECAQRHNIRTLLTGQGGNATVSWHGGLDRDLLTHIIKGQWISFRRDLRSRANSGNQSHWRIIKRDVLRPILPDWFVTFKNRMMGGAYRWLDYSAINPTFAQDLDIQHRMEVAGYDPTFAATKNPSEMRYRIIKPGRSIIGSLWQESGLAHGMDICDPTFDKRLMTFCLSIPNSQFVRNGSNRFLMRRAMREMLPPGVLLNQRRGRQAADIVERVVKIREELKEQLDILTESLLARTYLDLPKMKAIVTHLQNPSDRMTAGRVTSVLLRGLMVGLFLQRFE